MSPVETLGLALGAGFSSGLNLYATVATLGLLQRFGVLRLPPGLQALAHPWVLGIAIALYLLEVFADKIPYVDRLGRHPHFHPATRRCASRVCCRRERSTGMALGRRVDRWRSRSYFAWHKSQCPRCR